jgi:hypothetical protein
MRPVAIAFEELFHERVERCVIRMILNDSMILLHDEDVLIIFTVQNSVNI